MFPLPRDNDTLWRDYSTISPRQQAAQSTSTPQHRLSASRAVQNRFCASSEPNREALRRAGWYIKKRAASLGLTRHQDKRPWTAEEEESLERLLGKVIALTIARRLKRTEASVVVKIKRLGVSRRVRNGYTMRDLETPR